LKHTLRQLEVFVAIARLENVSRAAEALSLSQSAASTALAELERQFDCKLFDRMGKVLKLNELGRSLLPMAAALLDRAAEIESILQGKSAFGLLKVGATLTIGNYLATLMIGSFMKQHADCQVQLHVQNTNTVMSQVAMYDLDLGLIEGDCHHPDLEVEPWIEDELTVFCPPQHPLAQHKTASLETLLQENWVLREHGSGTRETFDHALRHHHTQLNVRLVLEHTEAIKRAVESGLGLGCVSRLALKDDIARGNLVALDTPELDLKRQFLFVWHKKKYQTTAVREFLAHCRQLTRDVRRSDEINIPYIP